MLGLLAAVQLSTATFSLSPISAASFAGDFGAAVGAFRGVPRPPSDLDAFWARTRKELSGVPLAPRLSLDTASSDEAVLCYKASYAGLGGRRAQAWYCRPAGDGPFPAVVISPWYGETSVEAPASIARSGFAVLWYRVESGSYILDGIASPETYALRALVADSLRAVDLLASRPEVDASRIGAAGASQGGGLSLILAALDPRIAAVSANAPFLSDFPRSIETAGPPYADIRGYLKEKPEERARTLATLSYFDALNIASKVRVPVRIEAGLRDETCLVEYVAGMFEAVASKDKVLGLYPSATHVSDGARRWDDMLAFLRDRLGR